MAEAWITAAALWKKAESLRLPIPVDVDFSFHFPDDCLPPEDFDNDSHLVARNDRPAEFRLIDTHKIHKGLAEIGILFEQAENGTRFRHRFDSLYSRYYRSGW